MEDDNTKIPDEFVKNTKKPKKQKTVPVDDEYTAELRNELLGLAERKLINYTEAKIKKASKVELERILVKFQQEQAEIVNNYLSETIIRKLSDLLDLMNVRNSDALNKDLEENVLLHEDLKTIISYTTPYIPMIGLVCGALILAKHWYVGKENKGIDVLDTPHRKDRI